MKRYFASLLLLYACATGYGTPALVTGSITPDNGGTYGAPVPTWQDVRRCVLSVEAESPQATGLISPLWSVSMTVADPNPATMYHLTWDCSPGVALSVQPMDFQLLPGLVQEVSGVAVFVQ